jgi:hypothetical protein
VSAETREDGTFNFRRSTLLACGLVHQEWVIDTLQVLLTRHSPDRYPTTIV